MGDSQRPVYLDTAPDPSFVIAHAPSAARPGAAGVVLCPPLGWPEECTYRVRRAWAQALANGGHAALRMQLPGTGDSPGSVPGAEALETWTSALATAARWLRAEFGCSRVAALGIGFGGMLAWLAAAQGAPVDDLILWGVPTRGRRLIRELRAAAQLDIDHEVEGADGEAPPSDGLLDEAGQVLSPELVAALSAVDLLRTPLPEPDHRHVLLLARSGMKGDRELAAHLQEMGTRLTVADGDSHTAIMRYVQHAVVPEDAIERSLAWLAATDTAAPGTPAAPAAAQPAAAAAAEAPRAAGSVELREGGVLVRETPVALELSSGVAEAIVTEPVQAPPAELCALFFSGGADRRTGPNRLWVRTSRRWAARGVTAVRLDLPGVGDADGDQRGWSHLHEHYAGLQERRVLEALDALQAKGMPGRFLLVGFCSGAYRALHVAHASPHVAGVIAIGLPFFHWTWWTVNVRDSWLALREPKPDDSRLKLRIVATIQRCLKTLKAAHHAAVVLGQPLRNRAERMLEQLDARGTDVLLLLKRSSYAHEQLSRRSRRGRLRELSHIDARALPGDDQRFRPLVSQRFVDEAMDQGLTRLLENSPRRAAIGAPPAARRSATAAGSCLSSTEAAVESI